MTDFPVPLFSPQKPSTLHKPLESLSASYMKSCSIHEQFNKANLIFKLTQLNFFLLTKGEKLPKKERKSWTEKG